MNEFTSTDAGRIVLPCMTPDTLEAVTARLAERVAGRTEADIQSDVRKFLLDAPLELADPELIDVKLEAQAGEGRRIDVEAGCAAIEVNPDLAISPPE